MSTQLTIKSLPPYLFPTSSLTLSNIKNVTVLFGKNGSGKSEILRNIAQANPQNCHYCNPEKAGIFAHNFGLLEQELSPDRTKHRGRNINENYYSQVLTRIQAFFTKRGAWVDNTIPPPVSHLDLEKILRFLLPDKNISLIDQQPFFKIEGIDLNNLSSGERQILGTGIDILTVAGIWKLEKRENSILLVDEPDAHLHPDLHINLALFLKKIVDDFNVQIIIATHSTTLLAAIGHCLVDQMSIVYLKRGNENQTAINFSAIQKELASVLGGHALMGPLFSVPILLVEGDDDYRIWSQVPRHHKFQFAVIPCNGEEIYKFQKSLENIFSALLSSSTKPCAYALLDSDKSLPDPQTTPQSHVKFIQLECHESENLYLSDEILDLMGLNWEQAKINIKSEASKFGNKTSILDSVDSWDRKSKDIKDVINELNKILDNKSVHWTTRVGQAIGKSIPDKSNQLYDFLGTIVCKSILL